MHKIYKEITVDDESSNFLGLRTVDDFINHINGLVNSYKTKEFNRHNLSGLRYELEVVVRYAKQIMDTKTFGLLLHEVFPITASSSISTAILQWFDMRNELYLYYDMKGE